MIRRILYIVSAILIIASCKNEETPEYERNPAVELSFDSFYKDGMYVSIRSINTDAVYIMAAKAAVPAPSAEKIVEDGIKAEGIAMPTLYFVKETNLSFLKWLIP